MIKNITDANDPSNPWKSSWKNPVYAYLSVHVSSLDKRAVFGILLFVDFPKAFDSLHREKTKQILLAYGLPREIVTAIMMHYRNTKVKERFPDRDMDFFHIIAGVLQGDILTPSLLIICLDYVVRTLIDQVKENGFTLKKGRSRWNLAKTITEANYVNDIALLTNSTTEAISLLQAWSRQQKTLYSKWM